MSTLTSQQRSSQRNPTGVQTFLESLSQHKAFDGHDIIIYPSSPRYAEETRTWGEQRNLKPEVVLKPTAMEQVQPIVHLLCENNLDFVVRNGGVGSASSNHVLISLGNFNSVFFDQSSESVTVGAGAIWRDVDSYMADKAPGWAVVGSRTPFIGVTGLVLVGGISWLSHEYGLVSDPQNMLDVEVALGDGRLIWASEEPDLLWAARGGRTVFGVITRLKFRARQLDINGIYCSRMKWPMSKIEEISRGVAKHLAANKDPKVALNAFITHPESPLFKGESGIGLVLFDRHGSSHAHSADGFGWAFDIEGGSEQGGEMSLYQVNQQTDRAESLMGKLCSYDVTGLVDEVDENFLVRAKDWFNKVLRNPDYAAGSYFLLETCQPPVFGSTQPGDTAFPHGKPKHVIQMGVGMTPDNKIQSKMAPLMLWEGTVTIPLSPLRGGDFTPTFLEYDLVVQEQLYGQNYKRLKKIADQYDPQRKFRSPLRIDPNFGVKVNEC